MKFKLDKVPGKNIKEKSKYITTKLYELGCIEENLECTFHMKRGEYSYIELQPTYVRVALVKLNKIRDFFNELLN